MNILWLCNKAPAKVMRAISQTRDVLGGWLDDMCERLVSERTNRVCVCYLSSSVESGAQENLYYYGFRPDGNNDFTQIIQQFSPDIIHIWGTEFPHTLQMVEACEQLGCLKKCVISIQGLVSLCGKYHYCEGLPQYVISRFTFRDLIKFNNINRQRKIFIQRGAKEIASIQKIEHVIGRTDWDLAATTQINPHIHYHVCNESLRSNFYGPQWDINNIERHSIFVSQCSYPIKGFHYLLEAMPAILQTYPDAHIYTTGRDLIHRTLIDRCKTSSYQKYIIELIKKFNLSSHITFLGTLSAEEMCRQYLKANVFVSASTIENSPNSVGEAMLLGCPVVSSDVGGVKNMLQYNEEGFAYQSSAPYMLAHYVKKIFGDDRLALSFSSKSRAHAQKTHDREKNYTNLLKIYVSIVESIN